MEGPVEKPYEFVPFPEDSPQREAVAGHQQFFPERLSGRLALRLTAQRPVQVASGDLDVLRTRSGKEVVARDATIQLGGETVHILPGSSLKGVLRSVVEALSPSCIQVTSWQTRRAMPRHLNACSHVDELCPACRLFGMTGRGRENYLGQVQVQDAVPLEGKIVVVRTPLLWTPARGRRELPRRYLDSSEARGQKLYYHGTPAKGPDARLAVGTGSTFAVQIHFANLRPGELGLLLTGLGQHPDRPFLLKVGAAKPVGLGSMAVEVIEAALVGNVRQRGRAGVRMQRLDGEELRARTAEWIDAAKEDGLLDEQALEDVWAILRAENLSRPSPAEAY